MDFFVDGAGTDGVGEGGGGAHPGAVGKPRGGRRPPFPPQAIGGRTPLPGRPPRPVPPST